MLTVRAKIIDSVFRLSKQPNAFDELERRVGEFSKEELARLSSKCGVIPEAFEHDSSEEKLWAKYCDILLMMTLKHLKLDAEVIRARGNSADVLAVGTGYSVVGDAKAFRLSRTAKNQKDFKVTALDSWRKNHTYACLVAPLNQYPNTKSQIYIQALQRNVTLISYTHLRFLVEYGINDSLESLFKAEQTLGQNGSASEYWAVIDSKVTTLGGKQLTDLEEIKQLEIQKLSELANEGISFWRDRIQSYKALSKDEAVTFLIKAEKIDAKIRTIQKAVSWTKL